MHPLNDESFEDTIITKARKSGDGWHFTCANGFSFDVPADSLIEPKEGMVARFYGKGIGFRVRGLFFDGQQVFYRTEAEDKARRLG